MTVEENFNAVEEADRLGAELLTGYIPSELFMHDKLQEGWEHAVQKSHTPEDCSEAAFWLTVTTNRYFAIMMRDEAARQNLDKLDWKSFGIDRDYWAGLAIHLYTGVIDLDTQELEAASFAFRAWAEMRVDDVLESVERGPLTSQQKLISFMWEGFLAGVMFAEGVRDGRPE